MVLTHSATVSHTSTPRTLRYMCSMQNAHAVSTASIDTGRWQRDCRTRHGATGSKKTGSYEPQASLDRSFRVSKKSCVRCRHMYTYEHACNYEQYGRYFLDTHARSGTSCDCTSAHTAYLALTVHRMHTLQRSLFFVPLWALPKTLLFFLLTF